MSIGSGVSVFSCSVISGVMARGRVGGWGNKNAVKG